ncbi:hypothetical protein [Microlunatus sp. Gsoil 973]|jgi:hypothetical protein|uniref:hypothetical protein n=1 Tax=Microlunatus sp. Gsoil 973 TaxID=2672569 RepID=UPI0012B49F80|nr:hypothetical protein [Microlunatus sp. Gsoil 973]QGN34825.1 hypothetical protein GJV80_20605 [Microlunatus sp. Gsoil 973]
MELIIALITRPRSPPFQKYCDYSWWRAHVILALYFRMLLRADDPARRMREAVTSAHRRWVRIGGSDDGRRGTASNRISTGRQQT